MGVELPLASPLPELPLIPALLLAVALLFVIGGLLTLHVLERLKGLDRQIQALKKSLRAVEGTAQAPEPSAGSSMGPDAGPNAGPDAGPDAGEETALKTVLDGLKERKKTLEEAHAAPATRVAEPRTGTPAKEETPATPPGESAPRRKAATKSKQPSGIDWERWVGIRGAAVVGSIALVLAGLFFVQVAIERGWLGPAARDLLALGIGALALVAHRPLRARKLHALADSVAGAGTVLMYGGAWAAARLHGLVPPTFALMVMAATTGTALLLSIRSNAPILASFALIGGFATPVLLGTLGKESTATLFGYVLVLDLALLALSRLRGWAPVVPAALIGTVVLQFAWSETNAAEPAPLWVIGLIAAGSAVLFTASLVLRNPSTDRRSEHNEFDPWILVVALGAPFVLMGRHLFGNLPPETSLWTIAVFAGVLICAAAAATLRFRTAFYFVSSALSSAVLLGAFQSSVAARGTMGASTWSGNPDFDRWAASTLALVLLLTALASWIDRRARIAGGKTTWAAAGPYAFALVSAFPIAYLALRGKAVEGSAFIGFIGLLVLIGCHGARFAGGGHLPGAVLGLLSGCTVAVFNHARYGFEGHAEPLFWSLPAFGLACFGLSHLIRGSNGARLAASFSAVAAFVVLPALVEAIDRMGHGAGGSLLLAGAAVGVIALATAWPIREREHRAAPGLRHLALTLGSLGVAMVLANLMENTGRPWRYAYLKPFHPGVSLAVLAAILGALPLATAIRARRTFRSSEPVRPRLAIGTRSISWITALPSLLLLTAPGPLAAMLWASHYGAPATADAFLSGPLRHALLVGGAALLGLVGVFGDRVDRRAAVGPLAVAATLAAAVVAREASAHATLTNAALASGAIALVAARAALGPLVQLASAAVLIPLVGLLFLTFVAGAFLATEALLPLQLTIDFGLVLAAAFAAHLALGSARSREEALSEPTDSIAALQYATAAGILALLFGWMNAAVLNQFAAPGETIQFVNQRLQARDLTLSISWGVFASALLAWGMVRRSAVLRWTSLCLFLAFILKVFLYDLGALTGLPRVGSFLGLAVALLGVSLLYARVLGTGDAEVDNLLDHDAP